MRNLIYLLLLTLAGCGGVKIGHNNFKAAEATVELAAIGQYTSRGLSGEDFAIKVLPVLQNKIRLDIRLVPFNTDTYQVYLQKIRAQQLPQSLTYTDSLAQKPLYAIISLMDTSGMAGELNAAYNNTARTYLDDAQKGVIVTSVAAVLSQEDVAKIKAADTYYLIEQDKRYTVALYKQGKRQESLDLQQGLVFAYSLGRFCWAEGEDWEPYIGDIVALGKGCPGATSKKAKEKEEENLFKM